jgi:MFS family permease
VIYGGLGLRAALLLDAASYLAIAVVGLLLKTRRNAATDRPAPSVPVAWTRGERGIGAWRFRDDRLLTYPTVAVSAVLCAISVTNVILVFLVRGPLGASATAYGLVEAVWILAMLGGSWMVARFAGSDARLTLLMLAFLGFSSLVLASIGAAPNVGWLVPLYLLGGLANGAENVIASLLLARRVPDSHRGRAFGVWSGAVNGASTAGYLFAGPVLDTLGPRAAMAASGGAGLVVVAALTIPLVRAVRAGEAPRRVVRQQPAGDGGDPGPRPDDLDGAEPAAAAAHSSFRSRPV